MIYINLTRRSPGAVDGSPEARRMLYLVKRSCSEARFAPRDETANEVSAAFRRTSEALSDGMIGLTCASNKTMNGD